MNMNECTDKLMLLPLFSERVQAGKMISGHVGVALRAVEAQGWGDQLCPRAQRKLY